MRVYSVTTNSFDERLVDVKQPHNLAILSHAVGTSFSSSIQPASEVAIRYGATCLWEFSICIDQTSTSDVGQAVTECYSRLKGALVCLVYLHDLPTLSSSIDGEAWKACRYWTRAWPLAEFVVPKRVEIFDCEWNHRGSKGSTELLPLLSGITNIPKRVLQDPETMLDTPASLRISWCCNRNASQPEDVAYVLMPILGINIPTRYGEGSIEAFLRLQKAFLLKSLDASILFWGHGQQDAIDGLLAQSPAEFTHASTEGPSYIKSPCSTLQASYDWDWEIIDKNQLKPSSKGAPIDKVAMRPKDDPSGASEDDESQYTPFQITGIKRKRSASSVTAFATDQNTPRAHVDIFVQEESAWDDDFSDSDSDSDCSCHCHSQFYYTEEAEEEDFVLGPSHELHGLRLDIVEYAFDVIQRNLEAAVYIAPPDDRLPPQKRFKMAKWETPGDGKPLAYRTKGYFHLACPFYITNPTRYQCCLLQHDLQSIEDVIRHVSEHHTEPPYCPICRREFERAFTRDIHVRERACTPSTGDVDGVNDRQKRMLVKKDKIQTGERKRWMRIWRTVFPNRELTDSPYLDSGLGHDISILRDCWASNGYDTIMEFLGKIEMSDGFELRDIKGLSKICLEDLVKRLAETRDLSLSNTHTS
ncbi:unnamed protein product [Clonostachys rhizophaga]|uniref:Vegetative incompatibility protein HET-E-1 n=1 Tax=Clonostachys rhizophaga TaxID=160324 RepID=A0A9N9VGK1_9HYPO|nr:unnamed protein product [Clonostachys rhizophaga]